MTARPSTTMPQMEWNDFEKRLSGATRSVKQGGGDEQELREYFGEEEFNLLTKLAAKKQQMRGRSAPLGNVVFVPGIMGTNLVAIEKGVKENVVWVDLFGLVLGELEQLKLTADGRRDDNRSIQVRTSTIDKRTYTRAMVTLGARWDVQPFAYDWRKDIDESSHALAEFIRKHFPGKPVHLVAHSMGGLVCRNFIRLHQDLWKEMRADNSNGGLLVMLGTPNYGSYAIPQALSGEDKLVRMLAKADLRHNTSELLQILNSFVGSYQMLPWTPQSDDTVPLLYHPDTWGNIPISQLHLRTAREFHMDLDGGFTNDPSRMRYIAGCNQKTLCRMEMIEPGKFTYMTSFDGDGRVPFTLGLLKGVPTFYVDDDHASLPKNEKVLAAVDQLLELGRTTMLMSMPVRGRAGASGETRWTRSVQEHHAESELVRVAKLARDPKQVVGPDERRSVEETLMRAAIGDAKFFPMHSGKKSRSAEKKSTVRTTIGVAWGDVTKLSVPVVVVGHYTGVIPINAIGAIDECLHHWIRDATQHSMIGGELGQLFFIPVRNKEIAAEAVLIAGMGQEGTFDRHDLRYLMMNVTLALSRLGVDRFATVLVGGGEGNIEKVHALRAIVSGVEAALERLQDRPAVKRVLLIELFKSRADSMRKQLGLILESDKPEGLAFEKTSHKCPGGKREEPKERKDRRGAFGPRITIEREGDIFRFSALTPSAIVPVREVEIQSFFLEGLASGLAQSSTAEQQEKLGRTLHTMLVPEDFQKYEESDEALTLILDRNTAWIPWEMACFEKSGGKRFFGTDLRLTRQFRTLLSSAPGMVPHSEKRLRALVIADPAPDPELQLKYARDEGEQVVRILETVRQKFGFDIEVIRRIGDAECDPVEILTLLLGEEFDLVHFAGHGVFDEQKPSHGGWVFGFEKGDPSKLRTLSAREIFRTRHIPRLVFSNACFSAVTNKGKALAPEETSRKLAGLTEAFFELGVSNYIGAGWAVADALATQLAREFYARALTGMSADSATADGHSKGECQGTTIAEALGLARRTIFDYGSTWGAYQHYGPPHTKLINLTDSNSAEGSAGKGKGRTPVPKKKAKRK